MNGDGVKELVNGIGAVAEISFLLYSDLKAQGFTANQSLALVKTYIATTFEKPKGESTNE